MMLKRIAICCFMLFCGSLSGSAVGDYRSAMGYFGRNDTVSLKRAVPLFKSALRKNPYYFKALRSLGHTYYKLRYFVLAEKYLRKALYQQATHIESNLLYAETLMQLNKTRQAKKHINLVLLRWPRNVRALYTDALYFVRRNRDDIALQRLKTVLQIIPAHYRSYIELGKIYTRQKRFRRAESALRRAVRYNSTSLPPYYALAQFYFKRGKIDAAYRNLSAALRIDQAHQPSLVLMGKVLFLRANHSSRGGSLIRWEEAQKNYQRLVRISPFNYIYRYTLALICGRLARFDKRYIDDAVAHFEKALKMRANDEIIRYNYEEFAVRYLPIRSAYRRKLSRFHKEAGDLLSRYNLYYRSMVAYRRAIRLSPASVDARRRLAVLYRTLRKYELFLKELKIMRMLDSKNTMLRDRIAFYKRVVSQLPSRQHRFKQYTVASSAPKIAVFDLFSLYNTRHEYFDMVKVIGTVVRDGLQPLSVVRLKRLPSHYADSLVQARSKAKAAGCDYFIHGRYIKGRYFTVVEIMLRSTVTGELLRRFRVSRRGNRQLFKIGASLAEKIVAVAPRIGRIIKISADKVVINIGRNHGVRKGRVYNIYPGYGFRYHFLKVFGLRLPTTPVGKIKIERVDEAIAFGVIVAKNRFDAIASYQYVVPHKKKKKRKK